MPFWIWEMPKIRREKNHSMISIHWDNVGVWLFSLVACFNINFFLVHIGTTVHRNCHMNVNWNGVMSREWFCFRSPMFVCQCVCLCACTLLVIQLNTYQVIYYYFECARLKHLNRQAQRNSISIGKFSSFSQPQQNPSVGREWIEFWWFCVSRNTFIFMHLSAHISLRQLRSVKLISLEMVLCCFCFFAKKECTATVYFQWLNSMSVAISSILFHFSSQPFTLLFLCLINIGRRLLTWQTNNRIYFLVNGRFHLNSHTDKSHQRMC